LALTIKPQSKAALHSSTCASTTATTGRASQADAEHTAAKTELLKASGAGTEKKGRVPGAHGPKVNETIDELCGRGVDGAIGVCPLRCAPYGDI